jgi:class 3 adenylate cyclase
MIPGDPPATAEAPAMREHGGSFSDLISEYLRRPDRRTSILDQVERRFRRESSIMVVDSCGFTRALRHQGEVPFLAQLVRLDRIVRARVHEVGGSGYFRAADNFYSLLPTAEAALSCGQAILGDVAEVNEGVEPPDLLAVSIGVGYGPVLLVGHDEIYGEEFNLVSKVGEDIAGPGELMVTAAGWKALTRSDRVFEERRVTLSGLEIVAYLLRGDGRST